MPPNNFEKWTLRTVFFLWKLYLWHSYWPFFFSWHLLPSTMTVMNHKSHMWRHQMTTSVKMGWLCQSLKYEKFVCHFQAAKPRPSVLARLWAKCVDWQKKKGVKLMLHKKSKKSTTHEYKTLFHLLWSHSYIYTHRICVCFYSQHVHDSHWALGQHTRQYLRYEERRNNQSST